MVTKTLSGWLLSFSHNDDSVLVNISHTDNSPAYEVESDIGDESSLCYRITSQQTESDYEQNGDLNGTVTEEKVTFENLTFELIVDQDSHLNIYCRNAQQEAPEQVSLTNGTHHSKECEIIINKAA